MGEKANRIRNQLNENFYVLWWELQQFLEKYCRKQSESTLTFPVGLGRHVYKGDKGVDLIG